MNSKRSSFPLALAMITLSAHTAAPARFRTDFATGNLLGINYIGDGNEDGGGDKAVVDTSVAGTGASIEQEQQSQQQAQANAVPQADAIKAADSVDTGEQVKPIGDPQPS